MDSLWSEDNEIFDDEPHIVGKPYCGIFRKDPRDFIFKISRPHAPITTDLSLDYDSFEYDSISKTSKCENSIYSKISQPERVYENQIYSASPPPNPYQLRIHGGHSLSNITI